MQINNLITILSIIGLASTVFYAMFRVSKYAFVLNIVMLSIFVFYISEGNELVWLLLYLVCPLMLINTGLYVFLHKTENTQNGNSKYQVNFATTKGNFRLDNIKRGASIIGSAGSGKTESVVYGFLKHFRKENFCGIIHDYKDFELTEMAYPLFKDGDIPFKVISFDKITHRVNPYCTTLFRERGKRKRGVSGFNREPFRTKRKRNNGNNKILQRCCGRIDWWIDLETEN